MRRRLPLLLAVALATGAPPAHAVESVFMDDDLLLHSGPRTMQATVAELKALGVDRLRVTVNWAAVAPGLAAEPAPGALSQHDDLLREAARQELPVLLSLSGGPGAVAPDPERFGRFVHALGERWDGRGDSPRVTAWSLWNEPNWGGLLAPQSELVEPVDPVPPSTGAGVVPRGAPARATGRTLPLARWASRSPATYRALHRAGTAALRATGHGGDELLLGETSSRGDARRGRTRPLAPVTFLADLLCLDPASLAPLRGRRAREQGCDDFARHGALHATGYAHHPYGVMDAPGTPAAAPADAGTADAHRLTRVLDAAAALGRLPGGLPLWWTEHGYETPPDPRRGIDPEVHARWLADAEQVARRSPRVVAHAQFLLRDTPPDPRFGPSDVRRWRTYQSGLRTADGTAKPALAAYRLPLSAPARVAPGAPVPVWGLVRPPADARGHDVVVELSTDGGPFAPVAEAQVGRADGAFALTLPPLRAPGRVRLAWRPPAPPEPSRGSPLAPARRPEAPPPVHGHPVAVALG